MKPVNWGVISTSSYGRERIVPAMMQGKNLTVSAIASREMATARSAAKELGIAKAYGSYQEILDDPDIEAVYIPLPNHLHVPWSTKAAEAGKHVLCEKPLAMNAAEAETLIAVQERTGMLIQEAFMVRTHPQSLRARELLGEGRIGELRAVHVFLTWTIPGPTDIRMYPEFGGGILYDGGCYAVTMSRFLYHSEPSRVVMMVDRDPAHGVDRTIGAAPGVPQRTGEFRRLAGAGVLPTGPDSWDARPDRHRDSVRFDGREAVPDVRERQHLRRRHGGDRDRAGGRSVHASGGAVLGGDPQRHAAAATARELDR